MQSHNIYCPECNTLLDKRSVEDGELIEKYCDKCKKTWIYKVEIKLKVFEEK